MSEVRANEGDLEFIPCIEGFLAGVASNDTCPEMREALKKVAAATRCASVQCMPGEAGNAHIAVLVHEDDAPRQRPTEMDGFRVEYYSVEPR